MRARKYSDRYLVRLTPEEAGALIGEIGAVPWQIGSQLLTLRAQLVDAYHEGE